MSDTSSDDAEEPIGETNDDGSKTTGNASVSADDSDKTSTPKNLSDMPIDVVGLIIGKSEYKEQLLLRKTSKSLRALVDQQKPACKMTGALCKPQRIIIEYDKFYVVYASPEWEDVDCFREDENIVIVKDDYEKIAFDDFASTLKNPNLQLEEFDFFYNDVDENLDKTFSERLEIVKECYGKLENILKSLNHQLSVEKYIIQSLSSYSLLGVLPYLKPSDLKEIVIHAGTARRFWDEDSASEVTEKLFSLDQWKQCEKLILHKASDIIPIEKIDHFKEVWISGKHVSDERLIRLRDQMAKIDIFESFTIWSVYYKKLPESICGSPAPPNEKTNDVSNYSIPDSDYYLEFMLFSSENRITIEKKNKKSNSLF